MEDLVGKDLLEQLMFSLYPEAETIYREYLQNACDSINEALATGLLSENEGHVSIQIEKYVNRISIEDNGTGIPASEAERTLKHIARSQKKNQAGFFGIGRLVGGGYCKKLTFITSVKGENIKSQMIFDVEQIRAILADENDNSSASEVIHKVTSFDNSQSEDPQQHYFKVILDDILPDYPELLDEEKILQYLYQVAPIPYKSTFINNVINPNITMDDKKYLEFYRQLNSIRVSVNDIVAIEKPYEDKFKGTEVTTEDDHKENAPLEKMRFFTITDPIDGDLAWGWYAYTPGGTQIREVDPYTQKPVLTRSIRLRCFNIQIGDENVLNKYFKQSRSHVYFNGEIFIINNGIKPTPDRSDIAPTPTAKRFQEHLTKFFRNELEKVYQEANKANKQLENIKEADKKIREIQETPISEDFPEESKAAQLEEVIKKRDDAKDKLTKIIDKGTKESATPAVRAVADDYKSRYDTYRAEPSSGGLEGLQAPCGTRKQKTTEEEIQELEDKYTVREVSMLRRIFAIMDARYKKKYESVVKSIKSYIINDLKK